MEHLFRPAGIGRGVVAFVATLALTAVMATVAAAILVSVDRAWPFSTVLFVALSCSAMLTLTAPIVFILTFPLRFTGLSRPVADVVIWAFTFVTLWLLVWTPFLNDFFDGMPLTALPALIALSVGGISGLVYWLFAGRPATAAP